MARGRKKKRTHIPLSEDVVSKIPKSFVIKSGKNAKGTSLTQLVKDVRHVMEPNTAVKLRERRKNKLRDFVDMAGPLGVTHLLVFARPLTRAEDQDHVGGGLTLRVGRIPRGPTLHFKVLSYSLVKDIQDLQSRPKCPASDFKTAPLVILNNFSSDEKEIKLMAVMFQNMFPPMNVQKMKLAEARRVVLFNYNDVTKTVDLRHYSINVKMTGVSKSIKTLLQTDMKDMQNYQDISEFVLRGAYASESDVEEGPETTVTLSSNYVGRNNTKSELRAIRLQELGPRLRLNLVKIQEGLCQGNIIYHQYVTKTAEQVKRSEQKRQEREQEKAKRRAEQESHVEAKRQRKTNQVEEGLMEIVDDIEQEE